MWRSIVALLALGVACCALAADPPARADPAVFVAPSRSPSFASPIGDAEWNKRSRALLDSVGDLDKLAKSLEPSSGQIIREIKPGRQAEALGLKPGEIISHIDDQPIEVYDLADVRQDRDQVITIFGLDGKQRKETIHQGPMGINTLPLFRPDLVYLRHGPRNPKWDGLVFVGAHECRAHPDFAACAWGRAMDAGYAPDSFSDVCGLQIAWRQGRVADAVAYAAMLDKRGGDDPALLKSAWAMQIAVADFKLEQALAGRMLADPGPRKLEGGFGDYLELALETHRKLPEEERRRPAPSKLAEGHRSSLMAALAPREKPDARYNQQMRQITDVWRDGHRQPFVVPTGSYTTIIEMPTEDVAAAELVVHAHLKPTDTTVSPRFPKVMILGLTNCDDPQFTDLRVYPAFGGFVSLHVESHGEAWVMNGQGLRQHVDVLEEIAGNREFTVRLLHAAGRDEVWINKRRLAYVPAAQSPRKIGFHVGCIGVTTDTKVEFSKINEE